MPKVPLTFNIIVKRAATKLWTVDPNYAKDHKYLAGLHKAMLVYIALALPISVCGQTTCLGVEPDDWQNLLLLLAPISFFAHYAVVKLSNKGALTNLGSQLASILASITFSGETSGPQKPPVEIKEFENFLAKVTEQTVKNELEGLYMSGNVAGLHEALLFVDPAIDIDLYFAAKDAVKAKK